MVKFLIAISIFLFSLEGIAQEVPLNLEEPVKQLNQELSGETAKRNLEFISTLHRMRGSVEYAKATDFIASKLKEYRLEAVEIITIPADGKIMYGTQKSRQAWDVEFAELWELEKKDNDWVQGNKIADWKTIPLVLAQDSESGEVNAELVDIGPGIKEGDYINKEVKGKLVLTSSQPQSVVSLAIEKYGAAGIISYAQNQVTAWWKEDENLIRWGHLDSFSGTKTFGFMISLKQARSFQERLQKGEIIYLNAKVAAGQHSGSYDILTAVIEGSDPNLKNEEITFSCHLDHPSPGANDNASGCVAILEVARTLNKLIEEKKIDRPKRTLRFIWSPEIEGTTALLNYKPELAEMIKFNIHMDMVGGGPETKAIFNVSRSPQSLPNFINDIGEAFGEFINQSSNAYASGADYSYPFVSVEGGKEALQAVFGSFSMGSDHQVFSEGSFRIPSIYLHDWPDRYIHTNFDIPAYIDPTKLKRAAFIGAASAYYIASFGNENLPQLINLQKRQVLKRASQMMEYTALLSQEERENVKFYFWNYEMEAFNSMDPYVPISKDLRSDYNNFISNLKNILGPGKKIDINNHKGAVVYIRNKKIKGPMVTFGYNYFDDHYKNSQEKPTLLSYKGLRGSGQEYTYEALNLVNGKRNVQEIRNILSAEFGPVPIDVVIEYLEALNTIKAIEIKK